MFKKVLLAVFSGIALFGIVLTLVGFLLGGRPGTVYSDGGQLVFENSRESFAFGTAPYWFTGRFYPFDGPYYGFGVHVQDSAYEYAHEAVTSVHQDGRQESAPFGSGELKTLEIDISAAQIILQPGDEWGLQVEGDLPYASSFSDGVWSIKSQSEARRNWTDHTTFILTVPENFDNLSLQLNAGDAEIQGLTLANLTCRTNAGTIHIYDTKAAECDFKINAGSIYADSLTATNATLNCNAGEIQVDGSIAKRLKATCDVGDITVTTPQPQDFGWQTNSSMGEISIDGQEAGFGIKGKSQGGNPDAENFFDLQTNLGSISIYFS